MSDYTLVNNWSQKEANADAVNGDDYQAEFEAVRTAVNSKTESVPAPTAGNLPSMDSSGDLQDSGLKAAKTPQVDATVTFEKAAVFDAVVDTGSGSTYTFDWGLGNKQERTMNADGTFTFTAPAGPCNMVLKITNSGAARTITWPSSVKWSGGTVPTPTTAIDIYAFFFDGTDYYGSGMMAFS